MAGARHKIALDIDDDLTRFFVDESEINKVDVLAENRRKALDWVKKARADYEAGETAPARGAFRKVKDDFVTFKLKVGREIVPIGGKQVAALRWADLPAFLDRLEKVIESGKLDQFLEGEAKSGGGRATSWTPERKAAQAEKLRLSWAKRKSAKPAK